MNITKVPKEELSLRMERFTSLMDKAYDTWELCAITGPMSMFYLTGTICDGILIIRRGSTAVLWARRSYERSVMESEFADIRPMRSFRDAAKNTGALPDTLYLDMSEATLEWYGLLNKYMPFKNVLPNDKVMLKCRAVKSEYELARMRVAGSNINRLLRENVPEYIRGGISEVDLALELFPLFIKSGHHGLSRFASQGTDVIMGHISFAEGALYPSVFNGASGIAGLCPAAPVLGSRDRILHTGDLIYVDIGFGVDGYNVDKTLVYTYAKPQPEHIAAAHEHCLELERTAASMLRPGVKPSEIYNTILDSVRPELRACFMGAPNRAVPFIGHGVGLYIDEFPVIAKGFDEPLECGMTIALEPKIGIDGAGMVGSENTYLVTESGGECLTGTAAELVLC